MLSLSQPFRITVLKGSSSKEYSNYMQLVVFPYPVQSSKSVFMACSSQENNTWCYSSFGSSLSSKGEGYGVSANVNTRDFCKKEILWVSNLFEDLVLSHFVVETETKEIPTKKYEEALAGGSSMPSRAFLWIGATRLYVYQDKQVAKQTSKAGLQGKLFLFVFHGALTSLLQHTSFLCKHYTVLLPS